MVRDSGPQSYAILKKHFLDGPRKCKVEKALVGNGEDDEDWRECEENDNEAVKVVVVRLETMQKWND